MTGMESAPMEELLTVFASGAALFLEAIVALLVLYGALEALIRMFSGAITHPSAGARRMIWMRFAQWIILALEFALGADIIRTAIAPTWDDVGKLAAIAAIRTGLSFFLERDMEALEPKPENPESAEEAKA